MWSRAPLALMLALTGCRGIAAEQPVSGDLELCCKAAGEDNISFVGCRATGFCRATESVWIRGPLTCTAESPDECAGARCCKLDLEALEIRGFVERSSTTGPAPLAPPASEPADPAPLPLDSQPAPTPIFVPNFVCPATVARGVSGIVLLQVAIDETGRVTEVEIRRPLDPECDALARDALLHAEFEPALTADGQPVASSLIWAYQFASSGN